jgi:hypothetical protein
MKKIYTGGGSMEAHFVKGLLEKAGIRATVLGDSLGTARGEVPLTQETLPAVWVNEQDVERAMSIVKDYDEGRAGHEPAAPSDPWTCPNCGEHIEGQFTNCWNCQWPRAPGDDQTQ